MTQPTLLVAIDQGVNLKKLRPLQMDGKISLQQVRDVEQSWRDIQDHGQPFRLDHSHLDGPDMLGGSNIHDVEAMFRKDQRNDFTHVYSAHQIGADYFVTNNPSDFINDGRREKLGALMPGLKIRTTEEFLREIGERKITQTALLGDIATIHDRKRIPLNSRQRAERQGDIPYYGATGILDYVDEPLFDGEYVLIGEDGENLRSKKLDLAFKVSGEFWVNNHAHILQGNEPWINDYIINMFRALDISPYITGAAQPKLNQAALMKIPIYWPGTKQAKKIANILGVLDEKIKLNRKMNETLEQIGQILFSHYFIDNPEVEKWDEVMMSDFAEHMKIGVRPMGEANTTFSQYSIPAFDDSMTTEKTIGFDIKSNKYKVLDRTVLISKLNPMTPRIWPVVSAESNAVCSTEFQVAKPTEYFSFVYFMLTSRGFTEKMARTAGGTSNSHRRVRPDDIFGYSFARPPKNLLDKFEVDASTWLALADTNRREIQTLTALRDTLLPRLISGKVKV